jgi:hypothetical protein
VYTIEVQRVKYFQYLSTNGVPRTVHRSRNASELPLTPEVSRFPHWNERNAVPSGTAPTVGGRTPYSYKENDRSTAVRRIGSGSLDLVGWVPQWNVQGWIGCRRADKCPNSLHWVLNRRDDPASFLPTPPPSPWLGHETLPLGLRPFSLHTRTPRVGGDGVTSRDWQAYPNHCLRTCRQLNFSNSIPPWLLIYLGVIIPIIRYLTMPYVGEIHCLDHDKICVDVR